MRPRPQETSLGPAALARRLRELRHQWPGVRVTQGAVAEALGASTALISGWENLSNPRGAAGAPAAVVRDAVRNPPLAAGRASCGSCRTRS